MERTGRLSKGPEVPCLQFSVKCERALNSYFFKSILLVMLLQFVPFFSSPFPPCPVPFLPPAFFPLSSRLWVVHINPLASPFPILFLPAPCLFSTYHLCFLFPVPFPPFSLLPLEADNPPCDLHSCSSCLLSSFFF